MARASKARAGKELVQQQRTGLTSAPLAGSSGGSALGILSEAGFEATAITSLLDKVHAQRASENNVRVTVSGDTLDEDPAAARGKGAANEPSKKDEEFLWRAFQAFDQNASGSISVLEVRALFDRVALEESFAAKGQATSQDKMLKAATKFITQLFDDDLDGKLGKQEMDRFFQVFNNDDNKIISWDEFLFHGSRLMASYRQKAVELDESKAHVPTREELKADAHKAVVQHDKEAKRAARAARAPPPPPKRAGGGPSMLRRQPDKGERSRSQRPGFA